MTGLQRVQGVVEKRNTMPMLSNILLEAKQEGAEIVATDLEIGMRGLYKATVQKPGGITLSARKLYEIMKELPSGEIDLTSERQQLDDDPGGQEPVQDRRSAQHRIIPRCPTIEREGLDAARGGRPVGIDPQNALCRR